MKEELASVRHLHTAHGIVDLIGQLGCFTLTKVTITLHRWVSCGTSAAVLTTKGAVALEGVWVSQICAAESARASVPNEAALAADVDLEGV